jgi:hypothetical protein
MPSDAPEQFWGPSPDRARAKAAVENHMMPIYLGIGGLTFWVFFFTHDTSSLRPGTPSGLTFAVSCFMILTGLWQTLAARRALKQAEAKAQGDVVWYALSATGLTIFRNRAQDFDPDGIVVPWTTMDSLVLVTAAEPVLVLTYRRKGSEAALEEQLPAGVKRADGVTLGERLRALYDQNVAASPNGAVTTRPPHAVPQS